MNNKEFLQRVFTSDDEALMGKPVLVALSGGADSVALLRALLEAGCHCHAAHCNFHLRGDESMRDEVVKNLSILIERGHLVAFHDDQLQIPSEHPPYRRLPKEKKPAEGAEAPAAEAVAEPAPAAQSSDRATGTS